MPNSEGSPPDATPEERSYAEFLSAADDDFERYCAERPELADALRRLHAKRRDRSTSEESRGESSFADRLAALYGDETVEATRISPRATDRPLSSAEDSIGAPRYRVLREFARGGMGIVFEVLDQDLDRLLAMKVIQAQHNQREAGETTATSVGLVQRFLREAKITAQLDHPGVVPVYDVGVHTDGCVYFTMRLVEGDDLRDLLPQVTDAASDWTTSRTVDVVLKVCETIAFCHDRGVVHRDLKPANIRVGRYGEVYVMDWGLAKLLDDRADEQTPASVSLDGSPLETLEGQVLGTPAYMAPRYNAVKTIYTSLYPYRPLSNLTTMFASMRAFYHL
ncbi:MAG: serine/threonine-protein kinase [Planctomycetota bacterium]